MLYLKTKTLYRHFLSRLTAAACGCVVGCMTAAVQQNTQPHAYRKPRGTGMRRPLCEAVVGWKGFGRGGEAGRQAPNIRPWKASNRGKLLCHVAEPAALKRQELCFSSSG